MLRLFVLFAGCIPFASASSAAPTDDAAAVRHAVSEYVAGWREGDTERLSKVFDTENGHIIWLSGEGEEIRSMTFGEALESRRPNPGYGDPYHIVSLDIVDGYLAVVKFDIQTAEGAYVDYLTLYKSASKWKIVAKTFAWRPGVSLSVDQD